MKITLFHLFLAVVASTAAQSLDELHIPVENDNQFPPDNNADLSGGIIEGSGAGAIEDPDNVSTTTEFSAPPPLEDVQSPVSEDIEPEVIAVIGDSACPEPCVCHVEGESNDFVVDCAGKELTELPKSIDPKITTLNIQNNKLAVIPKEISELKNLKVLNAANNTIKDLASGSVSELPDLTVLKLDNNRLIDYPTDLKNSFGLSKLEELDLGGNDMRTTLSRDIFSHFTALKKLTLPSGASELVEDLCASMKSSLATVCTESCNAQLFECPEAPHYFEEDLLNAILPAIAGNSSLDDNADPSVPDDIKLENKKTETIEAIIAEIGTEASVLPELVNKADPEISIRSSLNKASGGVSPSGTLVEASKADQTANDHKEVDVAVGATTSETQTGGVDKSVIGMIVAGMVVVVAGITIKKNWSSIRNRFSSSPRAANGTVGSNANGTTPEEVPLQEKSPV